MLRIFWILSLSSILFTLSDAWFVVTAAASATGVIQVASPDWVPFVVHTAVGALAGSAGALAVYPIDYVKSQLQTEQGRAKYEGGWDAAIDIVQTQGPLALYRGVWVNIIGVAPEKTVKLGANAFLRGLIAAQNGGTLPLAGEIVAGGFAGMTQVIVTNPLEVVKVKMQTSTMTLTQVLEEIKDPKDLYNGAGACIARDMVFSAVLFPLYAHAKVALLPVLMGLVGEQGAPAVWADLIAGSLAAAPAAIISTPADVVKTRIQQSRTEDDLRDQPLVYDANDGFFQVGSAIVGQEGPMVLLSGWFERCVRSVPQFGVTLAMFDVLNSLAVDYGWLAPGQ
jgi:solute carrier family 25 aspartate/glutamate transporter 12/13